MHKTSGQMCCIGGRTQSGRGIAIMYCPRVAVAPEAGYSYTYSLGLTGNSTCSAYILCRPWSKEDIYSVHRDL